MDSAAAAAGCGGAPPPDPAEVHALRLRRVAASRRARAARRARISLLNRTLERAEDAAAELGERVTPFTLESLGERLAAAELAIKAQ